MAWGKGFQLRRRARVPYSMGLTAALPLILAFLVTGPAPRAVAESRPTLTTFTEAHLVDWWTAHPDPGGWPAARDELHDALLYAQERHGIERAMENDHVQGWLVHLRWLDLYLRAPDSSALKTDPAVAEAFRGLSLQHEVPKLFVRSVNPGDDAPKALEILCRIATRQPEALRHYPALAVAFAVVFDQPFPDAWPHPFTKKEWLPAGDLEPERRFEFFTKAAGTGGLMLDPADLPVKDLTYMVDTPLAFSELQYVQQIELKNPSYLTALYSSIRYDVPRAQEGHFLWPHEEAYKLAEIGKRGGICADQAFFVSETGKAKGIPTILFMGQGRSGGHAWVGYLAERGQWELDVNRIKSEVSRRHYL